MKHEEKLELVFEHLEAVKDLIDGTDRKSRMQTQVKLIRIRAILAEILDKEFPLDPPRNIGRNKHMLGRDEIRMIRLRHERGDSLAQIAQSYPDFSYDHVERAAQGKTPYGPHYTMQHPSRAKFSKRQDLLGDGSRFLGRPPITVDLEEE